MQRPKHITWSPDVRSVERPGQKLLPTTNAHESKVVVTLEKEDRCVRGQLEARARNATTSLLLTVRRHDGHRSFQALVDLPNRRVRRFYDGARTWDTVHDDEAGAREFKLSFRFGSVYWSGDDRHRPADAKGFALGWVSRYRGMAVPSAHRRASTTRCSTARSAAWSSSARRRARSSRSRSRVCRTRRGSRRRRCA